MTVADQAHVFAAMMLCGAGTGMLHDLMAVFRRNAFSTAAADLLLGSACALSVIGAGLALRCDPFRLYSILGVSIGWALYAVSLGTVVRILTGLLIGLSKKVGFRVKNGKFMQENAEQRRT